MRTGLAYLAALLIAAAAPLGAQTPETPASPLLEGLVASGPSARSQRRVHRQFLMSAGRPETFTGNGGSAEFFVFTAEPADGRVLVGYEVSGAVDPATSRLAVFVGGRLAERAPMPTPGPDGKGVWELWLPQGALEAGWNRLRIEAELEAADACSSAAQSQLWLKLRPESSLLDLNQRAGALFVDPGIDGHINIAIIEPDLADPARAAAALSLAQQVGLRFPDAIPYLEILEAEPETPPDLIISEAATERLPGQVPRVTPQEFIQLVPPRPREMRDAGLLLEGDESYRFAELGIGSDGWSEQEHEIEARFTLPDDFYGAYVSNFRLDMRGIAAQKIDAKSRFEIYINGVEAASSLLPSSRTGREVQWTVEVPLHAAHPGQNKIVFRFVIPSASGGSACMGAQSQGGRPLFALLDSSTLRLSNFPRADAPSLMSSLTRLSDASELVVPRPSAALYTGAARIFARMAEQENRARDLHILGLGGLSRNALILAGADDVDPWIALQFGLSGDWLQRFEITGQSEAPNDQLEAWMAQIQEDRWYRRMFRGLAAFWHSSNDRIAPQENDTSVLISNITHSASNTLFLARDHAALAAAAAAITRAPELALHRSEVIVSATGEIRSTPHSRGAIPTSYGPGNLRLLIANFLSEHVWVYAALVLLMAVTLGFATWFTLARGTKS